MDKTTTERTVNTGQYMPKLHSNVSTNKVTSPTSHIRYKIEYKVSLSEQSRLPNLIFYSVPTVSLLRLPVRQRISVSTSTLGFLATDSSDSEKKALHVISFLQLQSFQQSG